MDLGVYILSRIRKNVAIDAFPNDKAQSMGKTRFSSQAVILDDFWIIIPAS